MMSSSPGGIQKRRKAFYETEGMHQIGELDSIADEEDGHVVAHEVPISLTSVELDGKPTRITQGLRRSASVHHRRKAHNDRPTNPSDQQKTNGRVKKTSKSLKGSENEERGREKRVVSPKLHSRLGANFTEAVQLGQVRDIGSALKVSLGRTAHCEFTTERQTGASYHSWKHKRARGPFTTGEKIVEVQLHGTHQIRTSHIISHLDEGVVP